jgi:hypothetical protein
MSNSAPQNEHVARPDGDMSTVPLRVSHRAHRTSSRAIVETGVGLWGDSEILIGLPFGVGGVVHAMTNALAASGTVTCPSARSVMRVIHWSAANAARMSVSIRIAVSRAT